MTHFDEDEKEELSPQQQAEADDYLSRLANSVLNKGKGRKSDETNDPRDSSIAEMLSDPDRVADIPHTPSRKAFDEMRRRAADRSRQSGSGSREAVPTYKAVRTPVQPSTPPPQQDPPPQPRTPTSRATGQGRRVVEENIDQEEGFGVGGTFPIGTILRLEDNSIAVFKDAKPDKEYEVIYLLRLDGSVKAQGVALYTYDVKAIGRLPPEFMLRLQRNKHWERDAIIYHLDSFDYCSMVPQPDDRAKDPMATSHLSGVFRKVIQQKEQEGKKLVRGRELRINFGPQKEWVAVYWGEDELGPVVAHLTGDTWALMHLDLKRFKESLEWGDVVDDAMLDKISADIAESGAG